MVFGSRPADWDVRMALESIRAQARHLYENNSFAKRAIGLMIDNILGSDGIIYRATAKDQNGVYDKDANVALSAAWNDWGKQADISGQSSWHDLQRIALTACAVDGEVFIRIIKSPAYKYGIKLQILESDFVDHLYNDQSKNIRMGIQYDDFGKVLGYWIWSQQPNSFFYNNTQQRVFFPANEIIHIFLKERSSMNRGVSWLAPVMKDLESIGRYSEAELAAAVNGAINIGVLQKQMNGVPPLTGDDAAASPANEGIIIDNSENLTIFEAPTGYELKKYENAHPNNQYPAFYKSHAQRCCCGVFASLTTTLLLIMKV
jgi:lambda family phage portal protein